MSRFDYVKYDEKALLSQQVLKTAVEHAEQMIVNYVHSPRAKALALTKLEEVYMWCGKGVRDDQLERNAETELQEERSDS